MVALAPAPNLLLSFRPYGLGFSHTPLSGLLPALLFHPAHHSTLTAQLPSLSFCQQISSCFTSPPAHLAVPHPSCKIQCHLRVVASASADRCAVVGSERRLPSSCVIDLRSPLCSFSTCSIASLFPETTLYLVLDYSTLCTRSSSLLFLCH